MLSEKFGKVEIKDCVFTVPSHWSIRARYQLLQAIELAGLNVLSLIHENTAAALFYSIERTDENKTHTVIFYNLGANNLQLSVVEYSAINNTASKSKRLTETVKVLADYGQSGIGGFNLDLALANHFASEVDAKPARNGKASIKENKKIM